MVSIHPILTEKAHPQKSCVITRQPFANMLSPKRHPTFISGSDHTTARSGYDTSEQLRLAG